MFWPVGQSVPFAAVWGELSQTGQQEARQAAW